MQECYYIMKADHTVQVLNELEELEVYKRETHTKKKLYKGEKNERG